MAAVLKEKQSKWAAVALGGLGSLGLLSWPHRFGDITREKDAGALGIGGGHQRLSELCDCSGPAYTGKS